MRIALIEFLEPLLIALRNRKLVVFAGAGVSMREPANLPNLKDLVATIAQGTGIALEDHEPEDRFLGKLKQQGVDVHTRAAQELSKNDPKPTNLHRDLLRLYSKSEPVRIVTTNFDSLFEHAAECVFDSKPEVFRAPALPLGGDFNGIVHVHGAIDCPGGMVLTDQDFGRAYLTEGWSRRFLVELFRQFTVLFVGYGHNDTVMNYLTRALPESEAGKRFALTGESAPDLPHWRILGIEPIIYPQSSKDDHSRLHDGVRRLVEVFGRGVLDWQREITDLAGRKPALLDGEEADLITEALKDGTKTRFFTDAATSPEWIGWLDKHKYLGALFGSGSLSQQDKMLAGWLAERFAHQHANELFLLIARHATRLHPDFWFTLGRAVASGNDSLPDTDTFSRWISLLLATAPAHSTPKEHVLCWLGECCIKRNSMETLIEIFDAIAVSLLVLEPSVAWPGHSTDDGHSRFALELVAVCDHYSINNLWEKGLRPNLDRVAEPLLASVVGHLTARYRRLRAWQQAHWDLANFNRHAIEPHEQDEYPEPVDVLIDAGRDSLEQLASQRPEVAAQWCDRLADAEAPLLRRLAVHTLSARTDLAADQKIDWLSKHIGLHDRPARHEVFRVVKLTYPTASPECRAVLIKSVLAFCWPNEKDEDKERLTAQYHYDWIHWLHEAAPDCRMAGHPLDNLLKRYPDLARFTSPELVSHKNSWTVKELLSRPVDNDRVQELLAFQQKELHDRGELGRAVADAASRNFEWGLRLADTLSGAGNWDTNLWIALLHAWHEMDFDNDRYQQILRRFCRTELQQKHVRQIADFLYALVRDVGTQNTSEILTQANEIAAELWSLIDPNEPLEPYDDWLTRAINHPAGVLAQFWLGSLSSWRRQQDSTSEGLSSQYREALSLIVQDRKSAGRLGRCVLAGRFSFLLAIDENWTRENLLPSFKNHDEVDEYRAVWDGFLTWRSFSPQVAELLSDAFLDAVLRIQSHFSGGSRRAMKLIDAYTVMFAYYGTDPLDTWVPQLFKNSSEAHRCHFAFVIGHHLRRMNEGQQYEWWQRWLRSYWENRLQGVPARLESDEVGRMLRWLADLTAVFPEAVALAIRMLKLPIGRLERAHGVINELRKSDSLVQNHPQEIAQLLVHLGQLDSDSSQLWYGGREFIDQLLQSDITPELDQGLNALKAKLGL